MEKREIDGRLLKNLLEYGYRSLLKNKTIINDLNVFPIPDGDTGDNMSMTLAGGLFAVKDEESNDISYIAEKCAGGMLNSARGNSGVILSQIFDGFSKGLDGKQKIEIEDLSAAFVSAAKQGYLSVDKPTEGTMLTVARETAENLGNIDLENITASDFIGRLLEIVKNSVDKTPDKLAKLKENGVVDSGGAGLYYIIEGISKYINGETLDEEIDQEPGERTPDIDYGKFNEDSTLEFGYCSEVLLQLTRKKTDIDNFDVEALKDFLNSIGDSIVVVKTGYVIKVHVHTFEPYKLLEYCGRFGEFLKIKIENMTLQHNETHIQNNFAPKPVKNNKRKKYGIVAVASGEGIKDLFKDFGTDAVIDGGQTNNPSSNDFIEAFDKTNADTIFVFPNNSNVILTAKQAAQMYKGSDVIVIESRNIGEGYAAISMIDFSVDDAVKIEKNMNNEIKSVLCGAITIATRTTKNNGLQILKDEYIGIVNGEIVASGSVREQVVFETIDFMNVKAKDNAVLIFGKQFTEQKKKIVKDCFEAIRSGFEIYEVDGKQDIYELYIIVN